jgi:hypothetical protein
MIFPTKKSIFGTTHMIEYSNMSEVDKQREIANIARTGYLAGKIQEGFNESLKQQEEQHIREMGLIEQQMELEEDRIGLISDQNVLLEDISELLYNQQIQHATYFKDLSYKTQQLIRLNELTNDRLDNLANIMMIPDFEKERLYKFAKGNEFMRQSVKYPE